MKTPVAIFAAVLLLAGTAGAAGPSDARAHLRRAVTLRDPAPLAAAVAADADGTAFPGRLGAAEVLALSRFVAGEEAARTVLARAFPDGGSALLLRLETAAAGAQADLAARPDDPDAAVRVLRAEARRAIVEDALVAAGVARTSLTAPPDLSSLGPAAVDRAVAGARRDGEPEVRAWLFALDPGREEIALALGDDDPLVRNAAVAAAIRREREAAAPSGPLTDESVRALIDGTKANELAVVERSVRMLDAAELTPSQREAASRALPRKAKASATAGPEAARVKVFYGTDRAALTAAGPGWWGVLAPVLLLLGVALVLPRTIRFLLHPRFRVLAGISRWAAFAGAALLLATGAYGAFRAKKSFDRLGIAYGGEWGPFDDPDGPYCHFGTLEVGIPRAHELGAVERPGLFTGEPWEDPEQHVMILSLSPRSKDAFFSELSDEGREHAFVFVHGFNVTFEDAALRTAQIAYDLDFAGAPIFFSWPSRGDVFAYTVDENTVAWATRHLKAFLVDVRRALPAATIHLVAHSMGNRALTEALRRLSDEVEREELPRWQEVVLAAPDIDAATFREDIAPAIRKTAERITLYASSRDRALAASREVHGYPRAGDTQNGVTVVPGIQTIDVEVPDPEILGHSYYGSVNRVLEDLVALLLYRRHPETRGLAAVGSGLRRFWRLE